MSEWNDPPLMPKKLASSLVFEESIIKIQRDKLQIDNQTPYEYYSLLTPPFAVTVLAITPEGSYLLNQEYRHPTGRVILGCPGGFIDPGEDVLAGAKRELLEETGSYADSYEIMGSSYPYAGFSGQKTFYVKAIGTRFMGKMKHDVSEVINPVLLTPVQLKHAIKDGIDLDGTLCTALFFNELINQNNLI